MFYHPRPSLLLMYPRASSLCLSKPRLAVLNLHYVFYSHQPSTWATCPAPIHRKRSNFVCLNRLAVASTRCQRTNWRWCTSLGSDASLWWSLGRTGTYSYRMHICATAFCALIEGFRIVLSGFRSFARERYLQSNGRRKWSRTAVLKLILGLIEGLHISKCT